MSTYYYRLNNLIEITHANDCNTYIINPDVRQHECIPVLKTLREQTPSQYNKHINFPWNLVFISYVQLHLI
jgi:hypothetical protein